MAEDRSTTGLVQVKCKPLHLRELDAESVLSDEALFRGLLVLRRELNQLYQQRDRLETEIRQGELLFAMRQDLLLGAIKPNEKPELPAIVVDGKAILNGRASYALDEIIGETLMIALKASGGKRAPAAQMLGISRNRVYRLLKHYKITGR